VTAVGSPVATAPGAAATAVALVLTARALRAGVEVADDAVTVRSWWRTRRFPRREVVGAATASHGEHRHGGTPARLLARQASRITGAHDVTVDGGR
jgi:hypothetical protein